MAKACTIGAQIDEFRHLFEGDVHGPIFIAVLFRLYNGHDRIVRAELLYTHMLRSLQLGSAFFRKTAETVKVLPAALNA